jgi:type II secretory pathway pseudopilin PulG
MRLHSTDTLPDRFLTVKGGFTLIELLIGAATLAIAIVALLGAFFGQITLNEHARNMTWAINDANRVMERLRQLNTGCGANPPSADPNDARMGADASATWDVWLTANGDKSIRPDPVNNELIVVSCRNSAGTLNCVANDDPKQITVAVCWRHRGRILGECAANGAGLQLSDGANGFPAGDGITGSPAMLTTLMTCRS